MQRRKKSRFSHIRMQLFSAACALLCAAYIGTFSLLPVHAIEATIKVPPATAGTMPVLNWPGYGQSAVGATGYGLLASSTTNESPVPIASITKIITALTVLQAKPLATGQTGPAITFTAADAALYNQYVAKNGTVAPAIAGSQLTQYQILQAMLIASANNYADTLAIWAYGSMDSYLAAAKSYLASQQLAHTVVADASGFSPESKSTAQDLVQLGIAAMKDPVVAQIVGQKTAVVTGVGTLQNTNLTLGSDGVIGIKTGTTDEAGSCLLFAATHATGDKTVTVVGVILGAPSHSILFHDVITVLASAKAGFQNINLTTAGQVYGTYKTTWGERANIVSKATTSKVLWANTVVTASADAQKISTAHSKQQVGTLSLKTDTEKTTVPLVTDKNIAGPSWQWRMLHPLDVLDS